MPNTKVSDNTSCRHLPGYTIFFLPTSRRHIILHSRGYRIKSPSPFQDWNPSARCLHIPLSILSEQLQRQRTPCPQNAVPCLELQEWAGFQAKSESPSSKSTKPVPLSSPHPTDRKPVVRERRQFPKVTQPVSYDQMLDATRITAT